jgi:pimeloyl-ACP methyl ester carboxylesterase
MTRPLRPGLDGAVLREHTFTVPLDHGGRFPGTIEVFAREVARRGAPPRPWLLYLQGGPGSASPRPARIDTWLDRALDDYRVLLLDQRGTGRSTPVTAQTPGPPGGPAAQADYLSAFRADSIVADCELIRRELLGESGRWTVLGQSFGGMCVTTYLSFAPAHLDAALITGGLPALAAHPDDIYRLMYPKVARRNAAFRARFPGAWRMLTRVRDFVAAHPVTLPSGDPLTVPRLQYLGLRLGMTAGAESLSWLLEAPFTGGVLSDAFLHAVETSTSLVANPLFAVLHEAEYCQHTASGWAADRVRAQFPAFAADAPECHFTGEMIYRAMFAEYAALRPFAQAADLLAARSDWPPLYAPGQLAANTVPVAAAIWHDDMYVARESSLATVERIAGAKYWITNSHEHDGLSVGGPAVLDRLLGML